MPRMKIDACDWSMVPRLRVALQPEHHTTTQTALAERRELSPRDELETGCSEAARTNRWPTSKARNWANQGRDKPRDALGDKQRRLLASMMADPKAFTVSVKARVRREEQRASVAGDERITLTRSTKQIIQIANRVRIHPIVGALYLNKDPEVHGQTPVERAKRAVWGTLYADEACVVSTCAEGLARMMIVIVEVFLELA